MVWAIQLPLVDKVAQLQIVCTSSRRAFEARLMVRITVPTATK